MVVLQDIHESSSSAKNSGQEKQHWPALDGLRGIAILLVFFSHFGGGHKSDHLIIRALAACTDAGWIGVDLFFALSGFLITGILFDTAHKQKKARNFYARRTLRIFPLFYGVLFMFLLLTPILHLHWHKEHLLYFLYLSNMIPIFAPHFRPPGPGVDLVHLWSLAVEEQFYLLWPFIVWTFRDRKILLWISAGIMAGALLLRIELLHAGVSPSLIYQLLFTRADSLICGGALALLIRGPAEKKLPLGWLLGITGAVVISIFFISGSGKHDSPLMITIGFTAIALFCTCLVYCVQQGRGWLASFTNHAFLRFFGRYSYGLYVYHGLLLGFFTPFLLRLQQITKSASLGGMLYIFLALLVSLVISVLSYHCFEAPILKMKRYFSS